MAIGAEVSPTRNVNINSIKTRATGLMSLGGLFLKCRKRSIPALIDINAEAKNSGAVIISLNCKSFLVKFIQYQSKLKANSKTTVPSVPNI